VDFTLPGKKKFLLFFHSTTIPASILNKNPIIMRKIKIVLMLVFVSGLLFVNIFTLFADNGPQTYSWDYINLPSVGDLVGCTYHYNNDWFTGSVEWVCIVQWVCPECRCTPEPCGEVSIGHKY
jgi:hypothetical protein